MSAASTTLARLAARARGVDRVWAALAALLAGLAVGSPGHAARAVAFAAESLLTLAPLMIAAAALVAAVIASGADQAVARVFLGRPAATIGSAALVGALSPLCGVEVLPAISALLAMGVPLPPVMAFWLASPITDPAMLVITAGTLGIHFAVGKTLAAFALGVLSGFLTHRLQGLGVFAAPLQHRAGAGCGMARLRRRDRVQWSFWRVPERRAAFWSEARAAALLMLKWLCLAFVLESLMLAWVPAERVAGWLGEEGPWAILLAVAAGTPAYLNGYAALPLTAGLMEMGMSPGAAMAFLVAGGVTSLPAAVAVYALVTRPVFAWYLLLAVTGSALAGFAFGLYAG